MAGSLSKGPPALVANRIDHGHPDHLLESLEMTNDNDPVRPGTSPGNIQMIPSGLRREPRLTVRRDPFSKCVLLPYEPSLVGLFVRKLRLWNIRHG